MTPRPGLTEERIEWLRKNVEFFDTDLGNTIRALIAYHSESEALTKEFAKMEAFSPEEKKLCRICGAMRISHRDGSLQCPDDSGAWPTWGTTNFQTTP